MRLRWNSASSRAKILADERQHCEQKADDSDGAENHCGMEGCENPCGFRRELRVIPGQLKRSDQAILDEDEYSVGDCISGHHRNDSVPKTIHPSNDQAQRPPPETPGRLQELRANFARTVRLQSGAAVRCSALLAFIGSGGGVLAFRAGKTVENPAVSLQTVLIVSRLIIFDPLDKLSEHRVLLLCRGKL